MAWVALLCSMPAFAETWVIEGGREDEIQEMVSPYFDVGGPGWELVTIQIGAESAVYVVVAENGETGTVTIRHLSSATSDDGTSASFAIGSEFSGAVTQGAVAQIEQAIIANDRGEFWRMQAGTAASPRDIALMERLGNLPYVALLLFALVFTTWRELRRHPRWVAGSLVGITVLCAAIRLVMSVRIPLGVWPYTRVNSLLAALWESESFRSSASEPFYFTDLIAPAALVCSVLTPVALFCHASQLFRDPRKGLVAALFLAVLPSHIRFSATEVAFIPSLYVSSLSFALMHSAMKEDTAPLRWLAACLLVPTAYIAFSTRPLNILFLPFLIYAGVFLASPTTPRGRQVLVCGAVALAGVISFQRYLLESYGSQLAEHMSVVDLTISTLQATFFPAYNSLLMPRLTPPLFLIGAAYGVYRMWKAREWRLGLFLVGWLFAFLSTHSVILHPLPEMTARYHLHIVVPFVLLAAHGLGDLEKKYFRVVIGLAILSPIIHAGFIRNTEFAEFEEWIFAERIRAEIPAQCVVLELTIPRPEPGEEEAGQPRFERMGRYSSGGSTSQRFEVVPIGVGNSARELSPEVARLLQDPPSCLMFYEGLPCWFTRTELDETAPVCAQVLSSGSWDLIESEEIADRIFDGHRDPRLFDPENTVPPHVALYRYTNYAPNGP